MNKSAILGIVGILAGTLLLAIGFSFSWRLGEVGLWANTIMATGIVVVIISVVLIFVRIVKEGKKKRDVEMTLVKNRSKSRKN